MDGLAPNDPNSLEGGSDLPMNMNDLHLGGPADEEVVFPAGGGSSIKPIVIPGALDLNEEEFEAIGELFKRAGSDNLSLEDWERAFFLGREDVYGLAVALPGLLTDDQRNWIIGRPPPVIVRDAIRAEFGLNSVADVFKLVHEDADSLTESQCKLIMDNFHPKNDDKFDTISGSYFGALCSDASQTDGVMHAAGTNLFMRDGMYPVFRKVTSVHWSPERRQVRRQRNRQRVIDYQARSPEEEEAERREKEERQKVWMAGAAAREEASSQLSDSQIAETRRLRELGPEAVQQSFLESLGGVEGGIEPGEESEMNI